jgi:regulator of sigma E protease
MMDMIGDVSVASWMSKITDVSIMLASFAFVLGILVFVHEYGHYWVAKKCGVKIDSFSVGFGPEIYGRHDKHGTRWKICLLPLGGYVKMHGDSDPASMPTEAVVQMPEQERTQSFFYKSVWQRIAIIVAGPMANFLFAIIVLTIMYMTVGQPHTLALVDEVTKDSAAEIAGIIKGDIIRQVDDQKIERFEALQNIIRMNSGQPVVLLVERGTEKLSINLTPKTEEVDDGFGGKTKIGLLGIKRAPVVEGSQIYHNPFIALYKATAETITISSNTLTAIGQLIVGHRDTKELGGPIKIAHLAGETAQYGFYSLFNLIVMLSINLGLINLFPVPVLDGGHLVFYLVEAIRGKPVSLKAQEYSFRVGLALVICLMIFATLNDVVNLFGV